MTEIRNIEEGRIVMFDTVDEFADYYAPVARHDNMAHWQGGMTGEQAVVTARKGHIPSVESSNEYMQAFESLAFTARKFAIVNAVAGGAPNVGAHLAGSPLAMRRRQRITSETAPLTLLCDLVSSGGIGAGYLKKRGAAVVALARMLAATRPVQLYAVGGLGAYNYGTNGFVMVKLPIDDLSRSAFVLAHTAAQRAMLYGCARKVNPNTRGAWPFNDIVTYRKKALDLYARSINVAPADCLYVPAIYLGEHELVPEKWLPDMLAKYGVAEQE